MVPRKQQEHETHTNWETLRDNIQKDCNNANRKRKKPNTHPDQTIWTKTNQMQDGERREKRNKNKKHTQK